MEVICKKITNNIKSNNFHEKDHKYDNYDIDKRIEMMKQLLYKTIENKKTYANDTLVLKISTLLDELIVKSQNQKLNKEKNN